MSNVLKTLKIGDEITLIDRGIRKYKVSNETYTDEFVKGQTGFMTLTKIGTKYIYGVPFWVIDEKRTTAQYETQEEIEANIILKGIHIEYFERYRKFRNDLTNWENAEQKIRYDLEYKYNKILWSEMDKWREENPRPTLTLNGVG